MNSSPRISVYLRLSRDSVESTSISRQREACLAVAAGRWPGAPVDVYEDVDLSGYKDVVRPELERLLGRIEAYDAVIVYRIDRLTRRGARHLLELVEDKLTPAGCALVSATEPVDTTGPFGELFLVLLASFARMESQRLGERSSAAKAHLRASGKWTGGPVPYGFQVLVEEGGKMLGVEPSEALEIRTVVAKVLGGTPLDQARPEGKGPSTYQGWKHLLSNPTLAGYRTLRGAIQFDDDGLPLQPWPAVIDPVQWRQLQPLLKRWSKRGGRSTLLGSLLTCGRCGQPMYGSRKTRSGKVHENYICSHRQGCWKNTIAMETADGVVLGGIARRLPEILKQAEQSDVEQAEDQQLAHLETVRVYLDEQMDRMLFDERRDPSDPAVRTVQERIDRARAEAERLATEPTGLSAAVASVLGGRDLQDVELDTQRRIVELLVDRIEITPGSGSGSRSDVSRITLTPVRE